MLVQVVTMPVQGAVSPGSGQRRRLRAHVVTHRQHRAHCQPLHHFSPIDFFHNPFRLRGCAPRTEDEHPGLCSIKMYDRPNLRAKSRTLCGLLSPDHDSRRKTRLAQIVGMHIPGVRAFAGCLSFEAKTAGSWSSSVGVGRRQDAVNPKLLPERVTSPI